MTPMMRPRSDLGSGPGAVPSRVVTGMSSLVQRSNTVVDPFRFPALEVRSLPRAALRMELDTVSARRPPGCAEPLTPPIWTDQRTGGSPENVAQDTEPRPETASGICVERGE